MEANYPKYVLYGLLIVGSWLLSCLLHFQVFHLSLFPYPSSLLVSRRVVLPPALDASFLPPPPDGGGGDGVERRRSSSSARAEATCDGRYVYVLEVPPRFQMLSECVEGSPVFEEPYHVCVLMANSGLGPVIPPAAGNGSVDGDIIPSTGWYNTDQYALEVIFHHRMRQYECLTGDLAAATAVYVAFYPALELNRHKCGSSATERNEASREFLRWLSSQPSWAALGGRDHFMVTARTTWMFRRDEAGDALGCGNGFLAQPESGNMTVLTYESNIWDRHDFAVPYPSYFHPSSAGEVAAWQDTVRANRRPWLFAFAGGRRANGTLPIRDHIIDECTASPPGRCGMLDCSHGLEGSITCRSPRRLVALFASARFCLQPPGDSFMRRSSIDTVLAGCIPVFFHEASTFKKQYRWHERDDDTTTTTDADRRRYSVVIDPDDVVEGRVRIEEVLSRFTDDEVAAMREEVIKMIPRFVYKDPRVRFEGDMRDAFDITFDEIMGRMRRIKKGEILGWKQDGDDDVITKDS
ncbi:xyloglucan galactosyltransferase KATAMARI1 homolog [Oryza brachyantha]|uniref:xyloglucan galactosyltransferase KATAMARI1 homolog n=1 Tax=Oryza brachyantha TaxID=4533 RepID=UPI001ADCC315|nr:xyloglucan galactosyltransferase KATAMARI1 homolog [Oryza brachyantha]